MKPIVFLFLFLSLFYPHKPGEAALVQKPSVIIVSALTCHGCHKFLESDDYQSIQKLYTDGLISVRYVPFVQNAPCLVGSCLAFLTGPQNFLKNYRYLMERQNDWAFSNDWKEKLKTIAKEEFKLSDEDIASAFRENSDVQNKFLMEHLELTEKHEIAFVPCLIVEGKVISASFKELLEEPSIKEAIEENKARS